MSMMFWTACVFLLSFTYVSALSYQYLTRADRSKMLEVDFSEDGTFMGCKIFTNRSFIEALTEDVPNHRILEMQNYDLDLALQECFSYNLTGDNPRNRQKRMTFSGTKWCQHGNKAANYHDLGYYEKTDSCCREHDHCDNYIAPRGGSKHGLTNYHLFQYRFHCDCENKFYKCLKNSGESAADKVGFAYFQVVQRYCFEQEYGKVCVRWFLWWCTKYEYKHAYTYKGTPKWR